jgi:4-hydroxy-3-methylbut-2-en-1-yl diphosphate synthase IspG/GcpE
MCTTPTHEIEATAEQICRLKAAGCDIVRVAVPDIAAAKAIGALRERVALPIVADIHFDYRLALEAAAAGADKIRINPGNIGERIESRRSRMPAAQKIFPFGSASTAALWKSRCCKIRRSFAGSAR